MSMSLSLGCRLSQRLALAQRLEMRLEQRLVLSLRIQLSHQELMNREDIEDPMRVRYFVLGTGKNTIKVIAKRVDAEAGKDPYQEVENMERFRALGFEVPEVLGVVTSNGRYYIITRFDETVANLATLITHADIASKFLEFSGVVITDERLAFLCRGMSSAEQLKLFDHIIERLPVKVAKQQAAAIGVARALPSENEIIATLGRIIVHGSLPLSCLPPEHLAVCTRDVAVSIAHTAGHELVSMQQKGIVKEDFLPRNILVRIKGGKVSLVHSGLRKVQFHDRALTRTEQRHNLRDVRDHFDDYSNLEAGLKKAFLGGYFGHTLRTNHAQKTVVSIAPEVEESTVAARQELQEVLVPTEAVATGSTMEVRAAMEHVILDANLSALSLSAILEKWYQIVKDTMDRTTPTYQEMRAYKIISYLYSLLKQGEKASLEVLEYVDDDEIRMEQSAASRVINPVLEKLGLPSIPEALNLLRSSLVLKFAQENLTASDEELCGLICHFSERNAGPGEGVGITSRRTVNKYLGELKKQGRIALTAKERKKVSDLVESTLDRGEVVDSTQISVALGLNEAHVACVLEMVKIHYLRSRVQQLLLTAQEIDVVDLSTRLGVDYLAIERIIEEVRASLPMATVTEMNVTTEAVREELEVVIDTTPGPIEEVRERVAEVFVSPTIPVLPEIRVAEIPTPALMPAEPEVSLSLQHMEHIVARVTMDPAYAESLLANELSISRGAVATLIERIYAERNLAVRAREVLDLILTRPGIEDDGIQAVTGLSVTDIHFIVRKELLSGHLRSGRPIRG